MTRSEGVFRGTGGLALHWQRWEPDEAIRAAVAIVHGFGEHSGRYTNVVSHLTSGGYVVYGFDHRGHGRSPGRRGHINRWSEYRNDVQACLAMIREQQLGRPLFLMGHSMGALIVLDYVLRHPEGLRGAVVSAAPLEPVKTPGSIGEALLRLLSRIWPTCSFPLRFEGSAVSRDPAVVRAYEQDPLVHGRATARWGTEFAATADWVKGHAADLRLPVLMIHGGDDRIASVEGSRRFFEAITFADKALRIYRDSRHEPHNDLDHEQVVTDLSEWLEKHL